MLKINAAQFKKLLVSQSVYKKNIIPEIEDKFVQEILVKGRYFYAIKNSPEITTAQCALIEKILSQIEINNSAFAFVPKRSYLDFFTIHIGNYNFVRFDIKKFFHSIDLKKLEKMFSVYFENEFIDADKEQLIIKSFMNLITYKIPLASKNISEKGNTILPIGFPTSPIISNIYMRDFDIKIQEFCARHNIQYSRYADDMLFSSQKDNDFVFSETFMKEVAILLSLKGLHLNTKKTIKRKHTISLNGYTLSNSNPTNKESSSYFEFRISNKKIATLKKFIFLTKNANISSKEIMEKVFSFSIQKQKFRYPPKQKFIESYCNTLLVNKIIGYRSYIIAILKHSEKHQACNDSTLEKYKLLLRELDFYLDKNPPKDFSKKL